MSDIQSKTNQSQRVSQPRVQIILQLPTPTLTPCGSRRPEPPWQPAVEEVRGWGKANQLRLPENPGQLWHLFVVSVAGSDATRHMRIKTEGRTFITAVLRYQGGPSDVSGSQGAAAASFHSTEHTNPMGDGALRAGTEAELWAWKRPLEMWGDNEEKALGL